MHCRINARLGLTALAAVAWLGAAACFAQENEAAGATPAEKKADRHNLVAKAFAIPYGTVLGDKQRSEYERLKADKEPALREAVAALEAAGTPAQKAACSHQVNTLTRQVRSAIQDILSLPYREALQARQLQLMQQGYASYGGYDQSGYPGSYDLMSPGAYGYYYYGPYYGYPWYGWPVVITWHHHHHHHYGNSSSAQQAGYSSGTSGTTTAQRTRYSTGTTTAQPTSKTSSSPAVAHVATTASTSGTPAVRHAAGSSTRSSAARPASRPAPAAHPAKHHS